MGFSLDFLSIFAHISGSRQAPLGRLHYWKDLWVSMMPILVKTDDVGRKAKARHGRLRPAQVSKG